MKTIIMLLACIFIFALSPLFAQMGELKLVVNYFNNFEVFYITDFDFNNGMNNPDIFEYSLSYNPPNGDGTPGSGTPINISIAFEMIANIPSLGLDNSRIMYILTRPFAFNGEVSISTQDLDLNMDRIYYTDGRELTGISIKESDFVPAEEVANLQTAILGGAKLPAGDYIFDFTVEPEGAAPLSEHMVVSVANPSTLDLVAPGGVLEDNIEIYSLYPLFQWESIDFMWTGANCPECGYSIRVSEYNPMLHSSIDEALNDQSNLPYPDNGLFYQLPSEIVAGGADLYTAENSFQFPFTNAKPLEEGKAYVWKVNKTFPTTSGSETVESGIFVFALPAMGGEEESGGTTQSGGSDVYLQILEQMIDADTFNRFFSGELEGYRPTGVVTLNETQQLTQDQLSAIAGQLLAGQITIKSIGIE
jgi:hypothetical protein